MKRTLIALTVFAAVSVSVAAARGPSSGPRACYERDLSARVGLQGGAGAMEGGVTVTNLTLHTCGLDGRPNVDFLHAGAPLFVAVVPGPSTTGVRRTRMLRLAPLTKAFVHLRWSNWCGRHYSSVGVRLWLMSVEPRVPVRGTTAMPRCDNRSARSVVVVGPWERHL